MRIFRRRKFHASGIDPSSWTPEYLGEWSPRSLSDTLARHENGGPKAAVRSLAVRMLKRPLVSHRKIASQRSLYRIGDDDPIHHHRNDGQLLSGDDT